MGLFRKTKTFVASTTINLSGPVNTKATYLKASLLSAIRIHNNVSGGIVSSTLGGIYLPLKRYITWATNSGYSSRLGIKPSTIKSLTGSPRNNLPNDIPTNENEYIEIIDVAIGSMEPEWLVNDYLTKNHQKDNDTLDDIPSSSYSIDTTTNTILLSIGEVPLGVDNRPVVSIPMSNYSLFDDYLYVLYNLINTKNPEKSRFKVLIYRENSGNINYDKYFKTQNVIYDWAPPIPIRINKKWAKSAYPAWSNDLDKATKKAFGNSITYDTLVDNIKEGGEVDDMHYVNVVLGTSLSTKNQGGLMYIFTFFEDLANQQGYTKSNTEDSYIYDMEYANYYRGPRGKFDDSDPPTKPNNYSSPAGSIKFYSTNSNLEFNYTISWSRLYVENGIGRLKLNGKDAKVGHLWWEKDPNTSGSFLGILNIGTYYLCYQRTANTWAKLAIAGGRHINVVYGGKSVDTTLQDALEDVVEDKDGEESAFVIPMNYKTLSNMSIIDGNELQPSFAYLVVNSYVRKKVWSGLFKVILVVVTVAVAVFTAGTGAVAGSGLLGGNVAVGAAVAGSLGLSLTAIATIGMIVNMLAAILLVSILTPLLSKIFGDVLGSIIATIITLGASIAGGIGKLATNLSTTLTKMLNVENLIKLTMSGSEGLAKYYARSTMSIMEEMNEYVDAYKAEYARVQQMMYDLMGYKDTINPLELIKAGDVSLYEQPDNFLKRTLMTGSDIAELTLSSIGNYSDITLSPELV